jgi:peptidyl-tRNA hydrolase
MALKLYIAVLDEMPDFMVPTLVAYAVLAAHLQFVQDADAESYKNWLEHSFRKVVVKVNQKEFDKIAQLKCYLGHESTVLDAKKSCAVVFPISQDLIPNVLKFAKMWKPTLN